MKFELFCRNGGDFKGTNGESSFYPNFDADGQEKMFVLSKVRVTVVLLNRIFFTRLNAWSTICPANVRTDELFVLSEFVEI